MFLKVMEPRVKKKLKLRKNGFANVVSDWRKKKIPYWP